MPVLSVDGIIEVREQLIQPGQLPDLDGLATLADMATEPNSFYEPWFLGPALRYMVGDDPVRLVGIWQNRPHPSLIALFPLTIVMQYGRLPIRHVTNWAHFQCFYAAPLIAAGAEETAWTALLTHLDQAAWAPAFLSLTRIEAEGAAHDSLRKAAARMGRPCDTVFRFERAMLRSSQPAEDYVGDSLTGKKRKELRRLTARLNDIGKVHFRQWSPSEEIEEWCDAFLRLEQSGWKGRDGAAMGNTLATRLFFREMIRGCAAAGRLDFQRIDLDDRTIAMLVNFKAHPGAYSFKIAFDEELARFSPGVMIELENLKVQLDQFRPRWMDSCAIPDHPMINSLWRERRTIIQCTVPLHGWRRRTLHFLARSAETASDHFRRLRN